MFDKRQTNIETRQAINEQEFMDDLYDVLAGNSEYCTLHNFREKYCNMIVEISSRNKIIFADENNEWHLSFQKIK